MSIVNRRNAVLGWGVWTVVKSVGKKKTKAKAKRGGRSSTAPTKKQAGALTGGIVALTGALLFWRRRSAGAAGR
jgi:hypothetical protein